MGTPRLGHISVNSDDREMRDMQERYNHVVAMYNGLATQCDNLRAENEGLRRKTSEETDKRHEAERKFAYLHMSLMMRVDGLRVALETFVRAFDADESR